MTGLGSDSTRLLTAPAAFRIVDETIFDDVIASINTPLDARAQKSCQG